MKITKRQLIKLIKENYSSFNNLQESNIEKVFKKKADKIFQKVQDRINKKGAYEDAGQIEIRKFKDEVAKHISDYQIKCKLYDYINNKIDNELDYTIKSKY